MQDRNNNGKLHSTNFPTVKYRKIDDFMNELEPIKQLQNIDGTKTYSVGITLGKGGFAKVFLAHEEDHLTLRKRTVAIKVVPKKRLQRADQEEKILREIDIQYDMKHQNIVKMFSSWQDSRMYCMVLEFCETGSVSNYQKQFAKSRIPEDKSVTICRQVLSALSYLHSRHIIHRDVKMGNILITNGIAKLADFGLCLKYKECPQTSICGTPNFLAPEVFTTKAHQPASDIWAFGCVLYSMLCGYSPFRFTTMAETGRNIMSNRYTLPRSSEDSASIAPTTSKKIRSVKPGKIKAPKKPIRKAVKKRACLGGLRQSMEGLKLESSRSLEESEPIYVTKWVDNYKHTGFGYSLSNGANGVFLKDGGTLLENGKILKYIDRNGNNRPVTDPKVYRRPIRYLEEFKSYMAVNLVPGCSQETRNENKSAQTDIRIKDFIRSEYAVLMRFSNGVYQMNMLAGMNKGIKVVITNSGFLSINKRREKQFYRWSQITGLILSQVNIKPQALVDVLRFAHDEITNHDKEFMSSNFDHQHRLCNFLDCGGHMII